MTPIEQHYRIEIDGEALSALTARFAAVFATLKNDDAQGIGHDICMNLAKAHALLRVVMTLEDPVTMMELSIAEIRKQKGELLNFPRNSNAG